MIILLVGDCLLADRIWIKKVVCQDESLGDGADVAGLFPPPRMGAALRLGTKSAQSSLWSNQTHRPMIDTKAYNHTVARRFSSWTARLNASRLTQ
jgi:hypothetical protein